MLEKATVETAIKYITSFQALAPLVTLGLFFIQAVLPVFPYMILAGAAGMVFGFWKGFVLAWVGALAGACSAFWVSRWLGKEWFVGRINERYHLDLESVDPRYGFWMILIARIFPVVPTPFINVAAGVGGVRFSVFALSSALGKIPTAVIYTAIGYNLYRTRDLTQALVLIGFILIVSYFGINHFRHRFSICGPSLSPEEPIEPEEE